MEGDNGPWLTAAVFARDTGFDQDGLPTAEGITDVADLPWPADGQPCTIVMPLLIQLRGGWKPSRYRVTLRIHSASGAIGTLELPELFEFAEPYALATYAAPFSFTGVSRPGRVFIDVLADGRFLTRMVLNIVFQDQSNPPSTRAGHPVN